jgi:lipid-binding SYLF domain-containing protein
MLVMSQSGVEQMLTSSVKLGADGSVAIGPKGMGAEGSTTPSLNADFLTFSRAKGLYAGVSFDGAVVRTRDELNAAYYGAKVRPTDIIIANSVTPNPGSKDLKQLLAKESGQE